MKELKDFIHLYLGCDLMILETKEVVTFDDIQGIDKFPVWTRDDKYCLPRKLSGHGFLFKEIKPILRSLSEMTATEKNEFVRMLPKSMENILPEIRSGHNTNAFLNIQTPEMVRYLLSKHFDIFGLIEAGLAIDKNQKQ